MNFDTILHLSCEHAVPIYRAARQVKAARHIVAVAHEHAPVYDHLQCALPDEIHLEKVNVRTTEPVAYTQRLIKVIEGLPPGRHALHLFGGSRTVFTTLWSYGQDKGIPCFFPDNETMTYRWANTTDAQVQAFEPVIRTVNDYFRLSGYQLDKTRAAESWEQSLRNQDAAMAVWAEQDRIQIFSRNIRAFTQKPGKPFRIEPQDVDGIRIAATLKQPKDGNQGRLHIGDQKFSIRPWKHLAAFLCGAWSRDILLKNMLENQDSLGILDIQTDCELTQDRPVPDMPSRYHIDIAYTDGKTLTLVQTLRKPPEIHHARNLRNVLHGFAHHSGKGILCPLKDGGQLRDTISTWPDISILSDVENLLPEH